MRLPGIEVDRCRSRSAASSKALHNIVASVEASLGISGSIT